MGSSVNPVDFTRSFLQETKNHLAGKGVDEKSIETSTNDMWINEYLEGSTNKLPSLETFSRDIKRLQSDDPSGQSSMLYCGLAVLAATVTASQVGSLSPGSPLFAGISGVVGKSLLTPKMEKEIGEHNDRFFAEKVGFSDDPELNKRLNEVGQKVLKHSSLPEGEFKFRVLDQETPNAHTSPGHIYVTKKMLEILPKDDHLAFYLGHEIAHLEDQDHGETLGQQKFHALIKQGTLMLRDAPLGDKTVGDVRREILKNFKESTRDYNWDNELAADRRGAELMAKAGYSPEEAVNAIRIPGKVMEEMGHKWDPETAQHPEMSRRMDAVRKIVEGI